MQGKSRQVIVRTSISSHSAAVRMLLPGGGVGMPRRVEGLVNSKGWASHCIISPSPMPFGRGAFRGLAVAHQGGGQAQAKRQRQGGKGGAGSLWKGNARLKQGPREKGLSCIRWVKGLRTRNQKGSVQVQHHHPAWGAPHRIQVGAVDASPKAPVKQPGATRDVAHRVLGVAVSHRLPVCAACESDVRRGTLHFARRPLEDSCCSWGKARRCCRWSH